jgi:ribosomal protein S21
MRNNDEFLKGTRVEVRNGDVNGAMRRLKKLVATEGIIKEYREKQEYVSKGERRRKNKEAAKRRYMKEAKKKQDLY